MLNTEVISGLDRISPLLYDVDEAPAYAGPDRDHLIKLDRYKSIINTETGEPVAVVGKNYTFMTHEESLNIFSDAVKASGATARVRDFSASAMNTRLAVWVDFPDIKIPDLESGEISLSLLFRNGIDGSSALMLRFGAFRFVCLNMCVTGKKLLDTYMRHTSRIADRVENVAGQIQAALEGGRDALTESFSVFSGSFEHITPALVVDYLVLVKRVPKKYVPSSPASNPWGLYNQFTDRITHRFQGSLETRATYLEAVHRGIEHALRHPGVVVEETETRRAYYQAERDTSAVIDVTPQRIVDVSGCDVN